MPPQQWCTVTATRYYDQAAAFTNPPVDLGNGVSLERLPGWVKSDEVSQHLSSSDRRYLGDCDFALIIEYLASSLGDPDPIWTGPKPRSMQSKALEALHFANLSLWLAQPTPLSACVFVHAEKRESEWAMRQMGTLEPLRHHRLAASNVLSAVDVPQVKALNVAMAALPREGAAWIAVRTLIVALKQESWELGYLMFWVVMEGLFGPEDGREITFRLSQRAALFLGSGDERKKLNKQIKDGYRLRSKLVHGWRLEGLTPEVADERMYELQEITRKALLKILTSPDVLRLFSGSAREEYLDGLAFS